jgi:DNA-binding NarL/FixJ family response regulator
LNRNKDGVQSASNKGRASRGALPVSSDRLGDILDTFAILRQDGQALIDQIRGSLQVMHELRNQLQEHRGASARATRNGSLHTRYAYLQLQYGLTARELEVAVLLEEGRSNSIIAKALQISTHTARHHTQRVLAKLGVHSRAEAGAKIRR